MYPDMFAPNYGVLTDTTTIKRLRCDLPSLPVNKYFNIPSHINSMYKEVNSESFKISIKQF